MAKCKWFSTDKQTGFSRCSVPKKNTNYTKCPRYADPSSIDSRCNIIPKKAKAIKRVRIMCWAYIGSTSGKVCVSSVKPYPPSEQCYAYITESKLKRLDEKYLGGKP